MDWARYAKDGYEVSSQGDTRFSALFAKLSDGRTIEEAYQLDVKGYRQISTSWRDGKGKPPLNGKSADRLFEEYLALWQLWVVENPEAFADLRLKSKGKLLTDKFSTTGVNQAHALAVLITEAEMLAKLPFTFE